MADRSGVSVDAKLLKRLKAAIATADVMELEVPKSVTGWIAETMQREVEELEQRIEAARGTPAAGQQPAAVKPRAVGAVAGRRPR